MFQDIGVNKDVLDKTLELQGKQKSKIDKYDNTKLRRLLHSNRNNQHT
jgi:hypothetical protein